MKPPGPQFRILELVLLCVVISFGVLCRLIHISQPFIDAYSWRQADVAMISENFYLHGFNIFYPQINWAGNAPGYVGAEFSARPVLRVFTLPVFRRPRLDRQICFGGFFRVLCSVLLIACAKGFQ